mmetsp:Transcript_29042/g.29422  ORF Transcript_29042/g.29422 Transcript_29042/m.29422 type:complete len:84 (+) Transcript_29042:398-649(+)
MPSLSNFLSGTWFWPSSMPANDDAPYADDAAAKAEDKTKEEKEPAVEPTKANPKKIHGGRRICKANDSKRKRLQTKKKNLPRK